VETVVAVFALLFVLCLALGAYATVKAVGAAKRGVDRTIGQARRAVEDQTLRAKSFAQPGPAGELAQLRLALRTSMRATQDTLYAGAAEDESLKESVALFERLSAHGHELDAELKRLESEPDRAKLAERLPALRERAGRISQSADALRWAARDRARRFAEDDLESLSAQIGVEADALRHWTSAHPPTATPTASPTTAFPTASPTASPAAPPSWPGPEAAGADRPGTPRTSGSSAATDPARPAISPSGRRPAYPWQKKPRPESTT
jgi:hypothetical protein